ncbi:MAG: hypothetical protein IPI68_06530 [Chitinophagaceae bacterium]|nr:hypothetical protein [Chitinophagaceae bacterium]
MKYKKYLPLLLFSIMVLLLACKTFYKANRARSGSANESWSSTDSLKKLNRYFILRNGDEAFYLKNIELSADQRTAQCVLEILPADHSLHLVNGRNGRMGYKKTESSDMGVLSEVHFYIPKDHTAATGNYTLQLDKITKIEVLEHDKKRTANSYVIGAVGYTLGAITVAAVIFVALKSSCPFVSAYNEDAFSLQGEIYGGAIYPQLARHDYMPLKMSPTADGSFQIKISNELKERQYTDIADLWIITHDADTKVLADDKGNLFSIANPQTPVTANFENNVDVTASLAKVNDNRLLYFDDTTTNTATNQVILRFNKKADRQNGKLVLSLKNSYWLDYLYGELAKGFGSYYATYVEQQKKKPAAELLKWVADQKIPLTVSVKTTTGWQKIKDITTIGPLATRDIVVPVDCSAIPGPEVEIKLSSGFMFWEIDYAAIDFSPDDQFNIQKLSPLKATDEQHQNVLPLLQKEDGVFLEQPQIGNVVTLVYKANPPENASQIQSFIMHSKGYYEYIRDFNGKPDVAFLNRFKQPGAFATYGVEMYKKVKNSSLQMLAKHQ